MAWDTYQRWRLTAEKDILQQEHPEFFFYDPIEHTYVSGTWRSNSGRSYGLHVQLPAGFPDECPSTYVTSPSPLYDYAGRRMSSHGTSHAMHTWDSDVSGWIKVCTYHPRDWSADQGIAKVVLKGKLWITAYECHLDTGEDIASFLKRS